MSQINSEVVSEVSTVPVPVPVVKQAVKFNGKYAGISTDCFVFLTLLCGVSETVAIKVANDAASSIGRVMQGVNTEVSFGRMNKDTLANIKETSVRKGVSVNEFPLQVAYLAEKTRKFCFDNKVKIESIVLPENLANYLRDLQVA
jgi:hypothetical protein